MTIEQMLPTLLTGAGIVFGGGGIAAIIGVFVTRRLGLKTNENEANKVINVTWEAIVDDLQGQIQAGREEFTRQITALGDKLGALEERVQRQDHELGIERRLVLKAIAHIIRLEALVPPKPIPNRPEGLE